MLKLTYEAECVPNNFTGMVEFPVGTKSWYRNGVVHREDGPAIEISNRHKEWFQNGKRHREDGPALEYADGDKEYWLNGTRFFSKKEYKLELEKLKPSCNNKIVVIDGKEYKLVLV